MDSANEVFLSSLSVWELSIKVNIGKLKISMTLDQFVRDAIQAYQLHVLPLSYEDCIAYERLGFPDRSHRDPFDRMIICQASLNGLTIISKDKAFDYYPIKRIW